MTRLAITGLGGVSPHGYGREALFAAASQGPRFATPSLFDASHYPGASVSEVSNFDPAQLLGDKGLRNLDRLTRFFLVAARTAMSDAGLRGEGKHLHYAGPRAGVCGSTAYGSFESMMELHRVAVLESPRYLNPGKFPNTVINAALGYVSIWEDLRALNATVCNGNCGALDAVLMADTYLESGRADVILVGGAEALHEGLYLAFDRLESLARTTHERPFAPTDPNSAGMKLGEGSVLFAVERADGASERGARVLAHVVGYGTAFTPPASEAVLVHVHPDPIERAVRSALADAGVGPESVRSIALSANGVPLYDRAEYEALSTVFGARLERDIALVAPKALYGETLGASGAFGMLSAVSWLHGAKVGPRAHADGGLDDAKARDGHALVITQGFYGNSSAVLLAPAS